MNIRNFWEDRVRKTPDKTFLCFEKETRSYSEFDSRVNQYANLFLQMGVKKGDKISLMLPNTPEFIYTWFGLIKIGAVMVPVNTGFRASETQYVVNHSEATGLVVSTDFLQIAAEIKKECQHLDWIACTDNIALPQGITDLSQSISGMPKNLKEINIKDEDLAAVIYTSGTTGFPKGAMHAHKNFTMTGEAFTLTAALSPEDHVMVILPYFHINAQFYSTMGAIAARACLVLIRKFSASRFWEQAVQYKATEFNFIGAVGRILCARPENEFLPNHHISVAYGAAITRDVYEAFTKRFKIPHVIDGYGLTEAPRVCQNPIGKVKIGSMGLPAKHIDPSIKFAEMKIVDDAGHEMGPKVTGELIVRTPVMMKGYLKDPVKTRESFKDGWFYTGDYAYKDEDGYYFFVDRKKDIIRRRGENISAAEVEAIINENPKVFESAVIAVKAELGEDEVMALVVLKTGQQMSPEEVIDWCNVRLATFKVPRFVLFCDRLPKTATERLAKHQLNKEELVSRAKDMEAYKKNLK